MFFFDVKDFELELELYVSCEEVDGGIDLKEVLIGPSKVLAGEMCQYIDILDLMTDKDIKDLTDRAEEEMNDRD